MQARIVGSSVVSVEGTLIQIGSPSTTTVTVGRATVTTLSLVGQQLVVSSPTSTSISTGSFSLNAAAMSLSFVFLVVVVVFVFCYLVRMSLITCVDFTRTPHSGFFHFIYCCSDEHNAQHWSLDCDVDGDRHQRRADYCWASAGHDCDDFECSSHEFECGKCVFVDCWYDRGWRFCVDKQHFHVEQCDGFG